MKWFRQITEKITGLVSGAKPSDETEELGEQQQQQQQQQEQQQSDNNAEKNNDENAVCTSNEESESKNHAEHGRLRLRFITRTVREDGEPVQSQEKEKQVEIETSRCLQCTVVIEKLEQSIGDNCMDVGKFAIGIPLLFWALILESSGYPALILFLVLSYYCIKYITCYFRPLVEKQPWFEQFMDKVEIIKFIIETLTPENSIYLQICIVIWTCVLILWIDGSLNDVIFLFASLSTVAIMGPIRLYNTISEWENNDIEEFLPAPTEDNLEVLKRAGDSGDRSSTPPTPGLESSTDTFLDDDFTGLKMPSYEEGSSDGNEFSELEFNIGDSDLDGARIKKLKVVPRERHLDGSSSEDEVDMGLDLTKLDEQASDDSDSDFEVIDSHELDSLKNV